MGPLLPTSPIAHPSGPLLCVIRRLSCWVFFVSPRLSCLFQPPSISLYSPVSPVGLSSRQVICARTRSQPTRSVQLRAPHNHLPPPLWLVNQEKPSSPCTAALPPPQTLPTHQTVLYPPPPPARQLLLARRLLPPEHTAHTTVLYSTRPTIFHFLALRHFSPLFAAETVPYKIHIVFLRVGCVRPFVAPLHAPVKTFSVRLRRQSWPKERRGCSYKAALWSNTKNPSLCAGKKKAQTARRCGS
jgi:hypothetical protein